MGASEKVACWRCRYFNTTLYADELHLRLLGEGDDKIGFGICHRFPMHVRVLGESDWCGEYREHEEGEPCPV